MESGELFMQKVLVHSSRSGLQSYDADLFKTTYIYFVSIVTWQLFREHNI